MNALPRLSLKGEILQFVIDKSKEASRRYTGVAKRTISDAFPVGRFRAEQILGELVADGLLVRVAGRQKDHHGWLPVERLR